MKANLLGRRKTKNHASPLAYRNAPAQTLAAHCLAFLSVALLLSVSSITPAQTATDSTSQVGSVVSSESIPSAPTSQPRTNGPLPLIPVLPQITTNAQNKLKVLRALPFDELKKKAEAGDADAQMALSFRYLVGDGTKCDLQEAVKWTRKAADMGNAEAQTKLGGFYDTGLWEPPDYVKAAVPIDYAEAVKWYRKAAEQGEPDGQYGLASCYEDGHGVPQDYAEAANWYRKAAEQGDCFALSHLGSCYETGQGVLQDYIEAYKCYSLAAYFAGGPLDSYLHLGGTRDRIAKFMTLEQIAEGQRRASQFVARQEQAGTDNQSNLPTVSDEPKGSGTGFYVAFGYVLTSYHVVKDANSIKILSGGSFHGAKVVKADTANDLALLQDNPFADMPMRKSASGTVTNISVALPILSSRDVRLGDSVLTLGFPNTDIQGIEPKLTRGDINSLSGIQDDLRFFQISAPVQPGNSGGPLVDIRGNVIGIVEARLSDSVALETSGALPQNVNYALKSSFLDAFLDSVPELAGKLKEPHTEKDRQFNDVVTEVQKATVMVTVY